MGSTQFWAIPSHASPQRPPFPLAQPTKGEEMEVERESKGNEGKEGHRMVRGLRR